MSRRFVLFLLPFTLLAQRDTGSLTGTARDASGAVLPGVSILVTNTQTNVAFRTTSNEAGVYVAPALRVVPIRLPPN
jgi:hypothetical protein